MRSNEFTLAAFCCTKMQLVAVERNQIGEAREHDDVAGTATICIRLGFLYFYALMATMRIRLFLVGGSLPVKRFGLRHRFNDDSSRSASTSSVPPSLDSIAPRLSETNRYRSSWAQCPAATPASRQSLFEYSSC